MLLEAAIIANLELPDPLPVLRHGLESQVSSSIRRAGQVVLRLLTAARQFLPFDSLKAIVTSTVDRLRTYNRMEPMMRLVPEILVAVVKDSSFVKYRTFTCRHFDALFHKEEWPPLEFFVPFVVQVVGILEVTSQRFMKLLAYVRTLRRCPEVYFTVLNAELRPILDVRQTAYTVIHRFGEWSEHCADYDCYSASVWFYEWGKLLREYDGDNAASVLCFAFSKGFPRFFPFFAALLKICKEEPDQVYVRQVLDAASRRHTDKLRILAFQYASKTGNYERALRLAAFECDCKESEEMMKMMESELFE
jgi:hypothetical protein